MNEVIISFFLFIIIVIIFRKVKKDKAIYIKNEINKRATNKRIINNISNTNKIKETRVKYNYNDYNIILQSDVPAFRGHIDEYKLNDKVEEGGSKPFNDYVIDDDNF